MQYYVKALASRRAPFGAVLAGAGMGLGLGAAFLIFGMAGHAADRAYAVRLADAAASGYAASSIEAEGSGLRAGLAHYGLRGALDAVMTPAQADKDRPKASRRTDLECLTTAVYYEARGESPRGQAAVAQVVLNRVKHKAFPQSVCGVVFQGAGRAGCQFSFACDGSMRKRKEALAWNRARNVAARALAGAARADIGAATHFHTTGVSPIWAPQMLRVANVGAHVFYKFAPYRLRSAPAAPPAMEQVLLTAGAAAAQAPDLRVVQTVEQAIETSLEPSAPGGGAVPKAATGTAVPTAAETHLAPAQPTTGAF